MMLIKSFSPNPAKMFAKIPLRTVLVVPFVLQIVGAVGLVGYLSFRNGRETVDNMANQLTDEIGTRIEQHVVGYLDKSHNVLRVTHDAVESDNLKLDDFEALRRYFWQVVKEGDLETYLFFGNQRGYFLGVERLEDGELNYKVRDRDNEPIRETYLMDDRGNVADKLKGKEYDPRDRPWYQAAKQLGKPTWSPIFSSFSRQNTSLDLSAVRPIFGETGELLGVLSNKTTLMRVTDFLSDLYISPNGQSFIMERSGDLVVSSHIAEPFIITGDGKSRKIDRLQAIAAENPTVSATAQHLQERFGSLASIQQSEQLHFPIKGKLHYARVMPLSDGRGIDWLVVVVMPEKDFMAQIDANTRSTILLSLAALLVATGVGIITARWITKPILQLNAAAKEIAEGHWEKTLELHRGDEVGELAESFDRMAIQLKNSFETLEGQNEQLKQFDRLKDEFLANTSHELRTPLNGIIGIGEFVLEGSKDLEPATRSNLATIVSSARRLSNLVNDILDFSKIRHHNLELQAKALDLRGVVEVVVTLVRVLAKNKNIELINAVPPDLPPVRADENRLQQILYNLIGNAIKFTESGAVEISAGVVCELVGEDPAGTNRDKWEHIEIAVCDTGIGIPEDKLDRIFESFEQGEGSTARKYGGTGLGLAVTKQLVELHGGDIWVRSTPGVGSRFMFSLSISSEPVADNDPNMAVSAIRYLDGDMEVSVDGASVDNSADGDFHILIVDDEPVNIQVLKNYLQANHYKVTQASNGKEALAALDGEADFDLILLDVMMPNMSGYEVCAKVREKCPAENLPILMLTAKNQVADLVAGFEFGANDYLTKPFAKDELLTRIKTHIKLSKITNAYGRFVPEDYLKLLDKESILDVKLGDRVSKEMAIFFSDIRSFTSRSEQMTPQEIFAFVNSYLQIVSPEIRGRHGLIIKFLGDGIMAVFPDSVDDAVEAAVGKLKKLREYNLVLETEGSLPIKVGIGIHLGNMMVGIVGEDRRMGGDALSDNVNLTARLEGLTKFYGVSILISELAFRGLKEPEKYRFRFLDRVIVKGRNEAIAVYEVLDGETEEVRDLKLETQSDFELGLEYYRLGELVTAQSYFEKVLGANVEDKTAKLYVERIQYLMAEGMPENWNGTWTFTQK
ncbi:MAG: ATP-binding protein [Cyanobacteriota bacterium]|nr:ATP-binding protein [Cyanobacteriota bacterium]